MESVADRLDRIVWDEKSLDQAIADSEFATGAKNAPVFVLTQPEATNGLGRLRIAVNWNGKLPAKHLQPANMIAMLMRKKQSIELLGQRHTAQAGRRSDARSVRHRSECGNDWWKRGRYSR